MTIITAPESYVMKAGEISVFLAGGITNCHNWQADIISQLEEYHLDKLVIFNPRRDNFPIHDPSASYKQILWEFEALEKADIFSMYFTKGVSDQPICMYELGRNICKMQIRKPIDWKDRIVISVEEGYRRKNDVLIQTEFACGYLPINVDENEAICENAHVQAIVKAYKACL